MIKFLVFAVLTLAGVSAFANDAAFPRINVKGIDPGPMKEGKKIRFYGDNASDFFAMLPSTSSNSQGSDGKSSPNYRSLSIISDAYVLDVNCSKISVDKNDQAIPNPLGTECTIEVNKHEEEVSDSYEYKPAPACQP